MTTEYRVDTQWVHIPQFLKGLEILELSHELIVALTYFCIQPEFIGVGNSFSKYTLGVFVGYLLIPSAVITERELTFLRDLLIEL